LGPTTGMMGAGFLERMHSDQHHGEGSGENLAGSAGEDQFSEDHSTPRRSNRRSPPRRNGAFMGQHSVKSGGGHRFYWGLVHTGANKKEPPPTEIIGTSMIPPLSSDQSQETQRTGAKSSSKRNSPNDSEGKKHHQSNIVYMGVGGGHLSPLLNHADLYLSVHDKKRSRLQSLLRRRDIGMGVEGEGAAHANENPLVQNFFKMIEERQDAVQIQLTVLAEGPVPRQKHFTVSNVLSFETVVSSLVEPEVDAGTNGTGATAVGARDSRPRSKPSATTSRPQSPADAAPNSSSKGPSGNLDWILNLRKGFDKLDGVHSTDALRAAIFELCRTECDERRMLATPAQSERVAAGLVVQKCRHIVVRGFLHSVERKDRTKEVLKEAQISTVPEYQGVLKIGRQQPPRVSPSASPLTPPAERNRDLVQSADTEGEEEEGEEEEEDEEETESEAGDGQSSAAPLPGSSPA
jgi:hypothetical protein